MDDRPIGQATPTVEELESQVDEVTAIVERWLDHELEAPKAMVIISQVLEVQ